MKVTSKQPLPSPRMPGVSQWYFPVPHQPCQVGEQVCLAAPHQNIGSRLTIGLRAAHLLSSVLTRVWGHLQEAKVASDHG